MVRNLTGSDMLCEMYSGLPWIIFCLADEIVQCETCLFGLMYLESKNVGWKFMVGNGNQKMEEWDKITRARPPCKEVHRSRQNTRTYLDTFFCFGNLHGPMFHIHWPNLQYPMIDLHCLSTVSCSMHFSLVFLSGNIPFPTKSHSFFSFPSLYLPFFTPPFRLLSVMRLFSLCYADKASSLIWSGVIQRLILGV